MSNDARHPVNIPPNKTLSRAFTHGQVQAKRISDFNTNSSKISLAAWFLITDIIVIIFLEFMSSSKINYLKFRKCLLSYVFQ